MSYQVIASHTEPGREERLLPAPPWVLGGPAGPMVRALSPSGQLYRHQALALDRLGEGKNLIVSTGPASGKTLVFQTGTMDRLAQDPEATALAVYPMRALAQDQLGRWRAAAQQTGADPGGVRRIDEDTEIRERSGELREARLALMNPDTIQSWLLSYADGNTGTRNEGVNRAKTVCRDFIRRLAVIEIDEAHVYEEAFGANMAYLLRRLRAKRQELAPGPEPLIIAAGAPITDPAGHMRKLTGLPWGEVTEADNGSPRAPLTVQHVAGRSQGAGSEEDMVLLIGELMRENPSGSCVVFTGDRQKAGRIAAGVEPAGTMLGDETTGELIEGKIRPGGTGGVVSAGALEMGIDIPGFTVGISLGLAPSIQRMKQRAGRARGGNPGRFIIMDKPHAFQFDEDGLAGYWNRPPGDAQLHLTNRHLQRTHAECLRAEQDQRGPAPEMEWPEGFSDILMDTGGAPEKPATSRQDPPAQKQYPHSHSVRDIADKDFDVILEGDGRRIAQMPKTRAMRDLYTWAAYRHGKQVYRVTAWHENGTEENGNPHIMVAPSRSQGRTEGITVTGAAANLAGAETREDHRGVAAYLDGAQATGRLAVIGCRTLEPDERGEAGWTERLYSGQPGDPGHQAFHPNHRGAGPDRGALVPAPNHQESGDRGPPGHHVPPGKHRPGQPDNHPREHQANGGRGGDGRGRRGHALGQGLRGAGAVPGPLRKPAQVHGQTPQNSQRPLTGLGPPHIAYHRQPARPVGQRAGGRPGRRAAGPGEPGPGGPGLGGPGLGERVLGGRGLGRRRGGGTPRRGHGGDRARRNRLPEQAVGRLGRVVRLEGNSLGVRASGLRGLVPGLPDQGRAGDEVRPGRAGGQLPPGGGRVDQHLPLGGDRDDSGPGPGTHLGPGTGKVAGPGDGGPVNRREEERGHLLHMAGSRPSGRVKQGLIDEADYAAVYSPPADPARRAYGPCLIWRHTLSAAGYGYVHLNGKNESAHRMAYEMSREKPPPRPDDTARLPAPELRPASPPISGERRGRPGGQRSKHRGNNRQRGQGETCTGREKRPGQRPAERPGREKTLLGRAGGRETAADKCGADRPPPPVRDTGGRGTWAVFHPLRRRAHHGDGARIIQRHPGGRGGGQGGLPEGDGPSPGREETGRPAVGTNPPGTGMSRSQNPVPGQEAAWKQQGNLASTVTPNLQIRPSRGWKPGNPTPGNGLFPTGLPGFTGSGLDYNTRQYSQVKRVEHVKATALRGPCDGGGAVGLFQPGANLRSRKFGGACGNARFESNA